MQLGDVIGNATLVGYTGESGSSSLPTDTSPPDDGDASSSAPADPNPIMPSPDPDGPGGIPGGAERRTVTITSGKELVWRDGAAHDMLKIGQEEELVDDGRLVFGNFIKGSIHGFKFEDFDADGTYEPNEGDVPFAGIPFELIDASGQVIDSQTTNSTGQFWFIGLMPGQYTVVEAASTLPADIMPSTPTEVTLTVLSGQDLVWTDGAAMLDATAPQHEVNVGDALVFGNFIKGSIHGFKFEDVDADGVYEPNEGEAPFAGIPFELLDANGQVADSVLSDINGEFWFTGLVPGDYTVREVDDPNDAILPTTPTQVTVTLASGQELVWADGAAMLDPSDPQHEVLVGEPLMFGNRIADPDIDIEKFTNGVDADTEAEAPLIAPGDPVTWTYKVTNTGSVPFPFDQVSVTDDQGVIPVFDPASDDGDLILSPGEMWIYEASDVAQLVSASPGTGLSTLAPDGTYRLHNHPAGNAAPPFYGLRLDGLVGGDADDTFTFDFDHPQSDMTMVVDGSTIQIAGVAFGGLDIGNAYDPALSGVWQVEFTYENVMNASGDDDLLVDAPHAGTNTGTITQLFGAGETFDLTDVADSSGMSFRLGNEDDDGGHRGFAGISGWGWTIHSGASHHIKASDWLFTAELTVPPGCYMNTGTVLANGVSDTDPSHYCNPPGPEIDIDKKVKDPATDQFTDDTVVFDAGTSVTFGYFVTNPGTVPLHNVTVVDDNATPGDPSDDETFTVADLVSGDGDGDGLLDPGEVWVFEFTRTADLLGGGGGGALPSLSELNKYLLIGNTSNDIAKAVNVQNGDLGADPVVLSTEIGDNVDFDLKDVFLNTTGNTPGVWVDDDPGVLPGNPDFLPGAAAVGQGVSWTGDVALTSPNAAIDMSNVELYGQVGVVADSSNPVSSVSNSLFFPDGVGDGIDPTGGLPMPPNGITANASMAPLRAEVKALHDFIKNLAPEATLTPGNGLPDAFGIVDEPIFETNIDVLDTNGDGIAVIDINVGLNDFEITNSNWIIEGDGSTIAIFRILGESNLVLNQSTIVVGDGGIAGAGPNTPVTELGAIFVKAAKFADGQGGFNDGEDNEMPSDTVFSFNDVRWERCTLPGFDEPQTNTADATGTAFGFTATASDDQTIVVTSGGIFDPGIRTVMIEAEDYTTIDQPWQVVQDASASGGQYLEAPDGTGNHKDNPPVNAEITYDFNVDQAGQFKVVGLVEGPSRTDDSFWVSIDGGPWFLWDIQRTGDWTWDDVNDRNGADPVVFDLAVGTHTLRVSVREDGSRLDKLIITNDLLLDP